MKRDGERRGAANVIVRTKFFLVTRVPYQYVFKDACFPLRCDDRIKIKTSSTQLPVAQIFY